MDVFASKLYVQLNVGAAYITDSTALTALTQANGQRQYTIHENTFLNPRPTKPFFVTQFTKGGGYHPPCELENETPRYIHVIDTIV